MVGSKPGFGRCVASRPSDRLASLPLVTRSSRTSGAATTTSPPTRQSTTGCRQRSMSSRGHLIHQPRLHHAD